MDMICDMRQMRQMAFSQKHAIAKSSNLLSVDRRHPGIASIPASFLSATLRRFVRIPSWSLILDARSFHAGPPARGRRRSKIADREAIPPVIA